MLKRSKNLLQPLQLMQGASQQSQSCLVLLQLMQEPQVVRRIQPQKAQMRLMVVMLLLWLWLLLEWSVERSFAADAAAL